MRCSFHCVGADKKKTTMEKKELKEILDNIDLVLKTNANDVTSAGLIKIVNTTNDPTLFLSALETLTIKALARKKASSIPSGVKMVAPGVLEVLGLNHIFRGFKQKFNFGIKY
jgi:hypothetical protein